MSSTINVALFSIRRYDFTMLRGFRSLAVALMIALLVGALYVPAWTGSADSARHASASQVPTTERRLALMLFGPCVDAFAVFSVLSAVDAFNPGVGLTVNAFVSLSPDAPRGYSLVSEDQLQQLLSANQKHRGVFRRLGAEEQTRWRQLPSWRDRWELQRRELHKTRAQHGQVYDAIVELRCDTIVAKVTNVSLGDAATPQITREDFWSWWSTAVVGSGSRAVAFRLGDGKLITATSDAFSDDGLIRIEPVTAERIFFQARHYLHDNEDSVTFTAGSTTTVPMNGGPSSAPVVTDAFATPSATPITSVATPSPMPTPLRSRVEDDPVVPVRNMVWPRLTKAPPRRNAPLLVALMAAGRLGVPGQFLSHLSMLGFFDSKTHFDSYIAIAASRTVTTSSTIYCHDLLTARGNRLLLFDYTERILNQSQKDRRSRRINRIYELSDHYGPKFNTQFNFGGDLVAQFEHRRAVNEYRRALGLHYDLVVRTRTDIVVTHDLAQPRSHVDDSATFLKVAEEHLVGKDNVYLCSPDYFGAGSDPVMNTEARFGDNDTYPMAFMLDYLLNIKPHRDPQEFFKLGWESTKPEYLSGTMFTPLNIRPWMRYNNITVHEWLHIVIDRKGPKFAVWPGREYRQSELEAALLAAAWPNPDSVSNALGVRQLMRGGCQVMSNYTALLTAWDAAVRESENDVRRRLRYNTHGLTAIFTQQDYRHDEWHSTRMSVEVVLEPLGLPYLGHRTLCSACGDLVPGIELSASCKAAIATPEPFVLSEGTIMNGCESLVQGAELKIFVVGNQDGIAKRVKETFENQDCALGGLDVYHVEGDRSDAEGEARKWIDRLPGNRRMFCVVVIDTDWLEFNVAVATHLADVSMERRPRVAFIRSPSLVSFFVNGKNDDDVYRMWRLASTAVRAAAKLRQLPIEAHLITS